MMEIEIAPYRADLFEGVRALWREAFPDDPPWNSAEIAIPAKLQVQPELFLVAIHRSNVVGAIMAGYDGHRGWLYALAVLIAHRRGGVGSALIAEAESRLKAMGCRKINLQVRTANASVIRFYEALGYVTEERVNLGKRLDPSS